MSSVQLKPSPGFCIKSSTLQAALLPPQPISPNLLEPTPGPTPVPKGTKTFINIAYDPNVPPPPPGSQDAIQSAMNGEDDASGDGWYVPVIVSDPRPDKDKAGNPSLVVDCIYNPQAKNRTLHDPEFKIFLIELALQRIEAQTGLTLSRTIAKPNIAAKGKLLPRTVKIPTALLPIPASGSDGLPDTRNEDAVKRPLIEQLPEQEEGKPTPKGILKKPASGTPPTDHSWTWSKLPSGKLEIQIKIPNLVTSSIRENLTTLDVEPRRIILTVPSSTPSSTSTLLPPATSPTPPNPTTTTITIDITPSPNPDPPPSTKSDADPQTSQLLLLKRERPFDVDAASAQWRVEERVLVVTC